MWVLILLVQISVLCYCGGEKFNPRKTDYCKLTCTMGDDVYKSSACHCEIKGYRTENVSNIVEFRKAWVSEHNRLRELVASGKETRMGLTSASDMQSISYSLEAEYVTRCLARNSFVANHDKCRRMAISDAGQNLAGSNLDINTIAETKEQINAWYEEITNIEPTTIDKFKTVSNEIGHFTQLIWAGSNLIGCTRFHTTNPKKDGFPERSLIITYWLICNYGTTVTDDSAFPNMFYAPVYKRGKPCSACHVGKCENPEYPSLCGKIQPIPTVPPYDFDAPPDNDKGTSGKASASASWSTTYCSLIFILFFVICVS